MDIKIGAITLVRDSAKFIIPHLKMYQGIDENIALLIPSKIQGGASGHGEADNSESLIRKYCPEVRIEQTSINQWGADLFNYALRLSTCDKIVMFHADVVMSKEEWDKLYKFIQETDYDVYKLDMTKCTINYYSDFAHGVRDCLDIEPVVVKKEVRFGGIYELPENSKVCVIDWLTVHHFCGWKGLFITDEWKQNKIPSESGVYLKDLKPPEGWLECPKNIKEAFNESRF